MTCAYCGFPDDRGPHSFTDHCKDRRMVRCTMAKMAARYGHFGIEELRSAVESISTRENSEIDSGYPQFSPQSDTKTGQRLAN
jgi:hypothetical protein